MSNACDTLNELTSVTDCGSNRISPAYDDAGRLTSVNSVTTSFACWSRP